MMSEEFLTSALNALEKIVVALIPVMLALIAYLQFRYAAQQAARDKQQARRVRKIGKETKHNTEKIEEAMTERKAIAIAQTKQISDLGKSGPQVTVEVKDTEERKD